MDRIPEKEIEAVRQKADIVDVIGRYLQLQKKGKSYLALCPFHDDHSPSMSVSQEKQIYKCFVCQAGGNVFTFVQNYEKVSFLEAVSRVANMVGYSLSVLPQENKKPKDPHKEQLYSLMDEMIRYTMYELNGEGAIKEKEYLEKRGYDDKIRQYFQIGFNPDNDHLFQFLSAKGYKKDDMTEVNVVRLTSSGLHDVFSSRITFPIHDIDGNPIGFSARTLDPNNDSKYINTNDTTLFHKSALVYNAHRAKASARKVGKLYVTEGVTDVIAFYKAGIEHCICTLGTSCTKQQIQIMRSLSPTVVFSYDGDAPGQAATFRAGKMALQAGLQVRILENKSGLDPDEYIRQNGVEAFQEMLKRELSWIEFVIQYYRGQTNFDNYLSKKEYVDKVMAEINALQDDSDKAYFIKSLADMTGFPLQYEPVQEKVQPPEYTHKPVLKMPKGMEKAEDYIVGMMLQFPEAINRFEEKLGFLNDELKKNTAYMIANAYHNDWDMRIATIIDRSENQEMTNYLTTLITNDSFEEEKYDEAIFDGAINRVKIAAIQIRIEAYKKELSLPIDAIIREEIEKKFTESLMELRRIQDDDEEEND